MTRDDLLDRLAGFCGRGGGPARDRSENDKIRFFHKTCADWLTLNTRTYPVRVRLGHELLATWCKSIFYKEYKDTAKGTIERCRATEPGWYLLKHGVGHFIEAERFADAVEFVNFLVDNWNDEVAKGNPLFQKATVSPRELARTVLLNLPSRKSMKDHISAASLINLTESVYQIGVLGRALDIIICSQKYTWHDSVEACLRTDNYVLRFKLAEALANACVDEECLRLNGRTSAATWIIRMSITPNWASTPSGIFMQLTRRKSTQPFSTSLRAIERRMLSRRYLAKSFSTSHSESACGRGRAPNSSLTFRRPETSALLAARPIQRLLSVATATKEFGVRIGSIWRSI